MILHSFRYPRDIPSPDLPRANNASRPHLIFLHGMGGNGSLWRPIAAGLEEKADLLCPDQRGHGESILPRAETAYGPLDYAQDLVDTTAALGFSSSTSPAWVIGHSMGVRTACGYAKLDPQAIAGMVLVDLGFSGVAGGGIGEALSTFLHDLPPEFPDRASARAFLAERCPDPSIAQYLLAVARTQAGGTHLRFPFDKDALLKTIEASRGSETGPWMETYAKMTGRRVYVLRGDESGVYSKTEFEADRARYAHLSNVAFLEMAGAGHGLPFEKRPEFVSLIESWIAVASRAIADPSPPR